APGAFGGRLYSGEDGASGAEDHVAQARILDTPDNSCSEDRREGWIGRGREVASDFLFPESRATAERAPVSAHCSLNTEPHRFAPSSGQPLDWSRRIGCCEPERSIRQRVP